MNALVNEEILAHKAEQLVELKSRSNQALDKFLAIDSRVQPDSGNEYDDFGGDVDGLTDKCPACGHFGEHPDCANCGQFFNEPVQAIRGVELCSGFSQFHTDKKKPLATINWQRITQMVDNPQPGLEKHLGQWLIPSTASSRLASEHEKHPYWALWFDGDHNQHGIDALEEAVDIVVGGVDREIYSTRSATPENHKARVLIPLESALPASDWRICQEILNDSLDGLGFKPDKASEKLAQLLFLPNRGAIYETRSRREGNHFQPLNVWAEQITDRRNELAQQEAEAEARKAAAQAARASLKAEQVGQDAESLIYAFNSAYDDSEILEQHGYARRGNTFRHPASVSGSFSASIKLDAKGVMRVHSLSTADPLYTGGKGVGARDAFDVFCKLDHGGNMNAAVEAAGDTLMIGGKTWNKVKRRKYMQDKDKKIPPVDFSEMLKKKAKAGSTGTPEPESTEQAAADSTPPPEPESTDQTTAGTEQADSEPPKPEATETPPPKPPGFAFVSASELLAARTPATYLVDETIETETLGLLFAPSKAGKSFLALSWACSVATGHRWLGKDVEQGAVFYLAGEGHAGLSRRLQAWSTHNEVSLDGAPLFVSKTPAQLMDANSALAVTQAIKELAIVCGKPALIVIDTFARNMGQGDENSNADVGQFVSHIDQIKSHLKCAILLVHHTGHTESERARGASALFAAMDCVFRLDSKGSDLSIVCTKAKESEEPAPIPVQLQQVELPGWVDAKGRPMDSAVMVIRDTTGTSDYVKPLTVTQQAGLDAYYKAAIEHGQLDEDGDFQGLHLEQWRTFFYSSSTADGIAAKRQAFHRVRNDLLKLCHMTVKDDVYRLSGLSIGMELTIVMLLRNRQKPANEVQS